MKIISNNKHKINRKASLIKALLVLKGIKGAEIARRCGVDRTAIYKVVEGVSKSKRLRRAIAEALEVPYESLWEDEIK